MRPLYLLIKSLFFFNILINPLLLSAQQTFTIKGRVLDGHSFEPIVNATVFVIDSTYKSKVLDYGISDSDGYYEVNLELNHSNQIIFRHLSYETDTVFVQGEKEIEKLKVKYLQKKNNDLNELIIIAEKEPIRVSGDTTFYSINAYRDINDVKLEDLLRKLPNVQVTSKGQIFFDNKPISTILIDGVNLLDYDYTIASKNIDLDAIEEIQGMVNYSTNELLGGIEKNEFTALNIKMKDDIELNGEVDYGMGYVQENNIPFQSKGIVLGLTSKTKFINKTNYHDVYGEEVKRNIYIPNNTDSFSARSIQKTIFPKNNTINSLLSNNSIFIDDRSVNHSQHLNFKKINMLFRYVRQHNEESQFNNRVTQFEGISTISRNDSININNDFLNNYFKLEIKTKKNKKYRIRTNIDLFDNSDTYNSSNNFSQNGFLNWKVREKKRQHTISSNFTIALNKLTIDTFLGYDQLRLLNISNNEQSLGLKFPSNIDNELNQDNIEFRIDIYGKNTSINKVSFKYRNDSQKINYRNDASLLNTINRNLHLYSMNVSILKSKNKYNLRSNLYINYYVYNIEGQSSYKRRLLLQPELFFNYIFNPSFKYRLNVDYNAQLPDLNRMNTIEVLTSSRTSVIGRFTDEFINSFSLNHTLRKRYTLDRSLSVSNRISYNTIGFYPQLDVQEDITINELFFSTSLNKYNTLSLSYEDYIDRFKSSLILSSYYSSSDGIFFGENQTQLDFINRSINFDIFSKTKIFKNTNYELRVKLSNSLNRIESISSTNSNLDITTRNGIVYNQSKILIFKLFLNSFKPNQTDPFQHIFSSYLTVKIKEKHEIHLTIKNIFDRRTLSETTVSEQAFTNNEQFIIPRSYLIKSSFSF